jgi:hypothetical protein
LLRLIGFLDQQFRYLHRRFCFPITLIVVWG